MFNEAVTDTIFYYTSLKSAYNILKTGTVNLTPTIRNDAEETVSNKKFYFMSLTRSRHGAYHGGNNSGVLFELDGRRLSQSYNAKAVDYWDTLKNNIGVPLKDEMEDRIFSDKPYLEILKYIKNITILYDQDIRSSFVLPLYSIGRKLGKPTFVYKNNKDWIRNNTKNSVPFDEIKQLSLEIPKSYQPFRKDNSDVVSLIELYHKKKTSELSRNATKLKSKTRNPSEFKRSVMNDIHNNTGSISDGSVPSVRNLIEIIKKSEYNNLTDFLDFIYNKWKKIDVIEERETFLKTNRNLIREFMKAVKGEYHKVDFSVFGDDIKVVSNRIRNLLYGMLRNNVVPNEDVLGIALDNNMSGYRVEASINDIVEKILDNVDVG